MKCLRVFFTKGDIWECSGLTAHYERNGALYVRWAFDGKVYKEVFNLRDVAGYMEINR